MTKQASGSGLQASGRYKFVGVECVIGRPPNDRRLSRGDIIELTEEQYLEYKAAGAALAPVEE